MRLEQFHYELPPELVAQEPPKERDGARMLVLHRASGVIEHKLFRDLSTYLNPNDGLFLNISRVQKARLLGERSTGGKVECLILRSLEQNRYECLLRSSASKIGLEFFVGNELRGVVREKGPKEITFIVEFSVKQGGSVQTAIEAVGHVPLPPYINRPDTKIDVERYQTVYAREMGSVAAPTAGLHFTDATLKEVRAKGVECHHICLHVGLGTFQPIKVEKIADHHMHEEYFSIGAEAAHAIGSLKERGGRRIAVGTTTVRTLESGARRFGLHSPEGEGWTDLFLCPGSEFLVTDGILTNFHQPQSSLVVLLSGFVGKELLFHAYREAIREKYRFFSYGDCMLVL